MRRVRPIAGLVLTAVALGLLLLGAPILVLQTAPVTRALVARTYDPASGGLPLSVALPTAEVVRVYTTDPASPPLPATVDGRPGFDAAASSHLRDVRGVLVAARALTLACAALLALALAAALPARRYRAIARVLRAGSLGVLAVTAAAAAAAVVDFDAFFGLFHGLFFASGTWQFPQGALLIELFPEPAWIAFGVLWAVGVAVGVAVAFALARALESRPRSLDAQDV